MILSNVQKIIDEISALKPEDIFEEKEKEAFIKLLNLVEMLVSEYKKQQEENQKLNDEINILKGEQEKPKFNKKKQPASGDISSEKERNDENNKKKRKKTKKIPKIKIDREIKCKVNRSLLPKDVVFKGYQETTVQNIIIKTDNIKFKKEVFYSPSLKKTYIASVPDGYEGAFGPGIKAHVLNFSHNLNISQQALIRFFKTAGVYISAGTISNILIKGKDVDQFHQEKSDIVNSGTQMPYQNIDDTVSKVNGKNHYTHILCNSLFTAYFTMPRKNRLTVLNILCKGDIQFFINEEAYDLMSNLGLAKKHIEKIKKLIPIKKYTKKELNVFIRKLFPNPKKNKRHKKIIIEACAIAGFHKKEKNIKALICDDAPQFKHLLDIALCWVHEGRHYKKLNPIIPMHKEKQAEFIKKFWDFYKSLLDYKLNPNNVDAEKLSDEFDILFSVKTGYDKLDEFIRKTLTKKNSLLLVLKYPMFPLHNNEAELGARVQKRKGDVSLQTKNKKGTTAKDTFMTIVQTALKLSVNIYDYIYDRITKAFELPSLAELITQTSKNENVFCNSS